MHRKLLGVLALASLATIGGAAHASQAGNSPTAAIGGQTQPVSHYAPGVPAIQLGAGATSPTSIQAAAQQYLTVHPVLRPLPGTAHPMKVSLLSAAQASALLNGESIGRPADAMVIYVEVQGPLSAAGIPLPPGQTMGSPVQEEQLVFDAQTGNLLVIGL